MTANQSTDLLSVTGLDVSFGQVWATKAVGLQLGRGRVLGIVGESGSGKSTVVSAVMRLLPYGAKIENGEIIFDGRDLLRLPEAEMRQLRGSRISYVSQDPMSALNPVLTIGEQMLDIQHWDNAGSSLKRERAVAALTRVRIPEPSARLKMYPHELSGGQRQRVSIAMATMSRPSLLIADEPTTALDATLELEIVDLLKELKAEIGCSIIFVTHHLGLVEALCDDVVVMNHGVVRESGKVAEVFGHPQDDYTRRLLDCDPSRIKEKCRRLPTMAAPETKVPADPLLDAQRIREDEPPLLSIKDLSVTFRRPLALMDLFHRRPASRVAAVKGVSLELRRGETVALVGESGSGKTTVARSLLRLVKAKGGTIEFAGHNIGALDARSLMALRRRIAMMFQDPVGSLSPRMRVGSIITEPLKIGRVKVDDWRVAADRLLDLVGLPTSFAARYPHELSGGQARRVGVARALALSPELVIADEPTAGLDVSVQGEVLNLLMELRERLRMSILIITHNLHVVRHISDRVAIMYQGEIVEEGSTEAIFERPGHAYTRKLLAANLHVALAG